MNTNTIRIINRFGSISFDPKYRPFVICDIDNTLICSSTSYNYYYHQLKPSYSDSETDMYNLHRSILDMLHIDVCSGMVQQTDKAGFDTMVAIIKQLGGKLVFLTSRSPCFHLKTLQDLKNAGLEQPELYDIRYTNNDITKGKYIKKYFLHELECFQQLVFIDDQKPIVDEVAYMHPKIRCYLFNIY